jgi:glutamyl-tRNA reductase
MTLLVIGINHKTAPLSVREKMSFSKEHQITLLKELLDEADINEAVVLTTCNRTEIYTDCPIAEPVLNTILCNSSINREELQNSLYIYKDILAVEHIMTVACGLDSMVLGEQQILGQMKTAVNLAAEHKSIDRYFHTLFQRVFTLAKRVRTTTEIGACPVSIASIAVKLASQHFDKPDQLNVLLLGAGDTINLVSKYLFKNGFNNITIASRHIEKAKALADLFGGQGISLTDIASHLPTADIIMSATASEVPILGKGRIESALKVREKDSPLFLVDMAVPRDIEAEVAELENASLYTIDDLKSVAESNLDERKHAAKQATASIKEHAADYMQWLNGLESTDMIRAFRSHVDSIKQNELDKAYQLLAQGIDPQQVLGSLANNLTKKIMHEPSIKMRSACEYGRTELLKTVQELFAINLNNY